MVSYSDIKFDCRYFKGDVPCAPNKLRGKVCSTCDEYSPISKRIVIIKLGALGDVIRSTPLVSKFREEFPNCHISWITNSPEVLREDCIDEIFKNDDRASSIIMNTKFDIAVNLDKDREACILMKNISAASKYGFIWNNYHIEALGNAAQKKLLTGLFDDYSKRNTKSYLEEIFEICGFNFSNEPHLLRVNKNLIEKWSVLKAKANGKDIIGLNTGCGERWRTRLWPSSHWIALVNSLHRNNFFPVLLGGPGEDEWNRKYSEETGAYYPGVFSLDEFIAISANCDIIVTAVSLMMHIGIGLKKPIVLFNNIFNKYEFELYGNGEILEPKTGCDCYYGNVCTRQKHCMEDLEPETVLHSIIRQLS